jgi:hypothetical protein
MYAVCARQPNPCACQMSELEPVEVYLMTTYESADEFFKSKSDTMLAADDLQGHEVKVEIESYEFREFPDQTKMILSFKNREKQLALNKTNGKAIRAGLGDHFADWLGQEIILYPTTTEFNNQTVPCIRVRIPAKVATDDSEIPF